MKAIKASRPQVDLLTFAQEGQLCKCMGLCSLLYGALRPGVRCLDQLESRSVFHNVVFSRDVGVHALGLIQLQESQNLGLIGLIVPLSFSWIVAHALVRDGLIVRDYGALSVYAPHWVIEGI